MSDLLRVYLDPAEIGMDGYPYAWHGEKRLTASHPDIVAVARRGTAIKDLIRERDGHRCQRCHLSVQTRVVMDREYDRPHSDWFKPFVCGYYAWAYLGEEISREEADERQDELLGLALRQQTLFGADGVTIVAQT